MTSASPGFVKLASKPLLEVEVLLEVGRDGRSFTYLDSHGWGVCFGDLVTVRLQDRLMNGLVVETRDSSRFYEGQDLKQLPAKLRLKAIENIVQPSAVDALWFDWVKAISLKCHVSTYRMLKAAMPAGWLGRLGSSQRPLKNNWWIEVDKSDDHSKSLPKRQRDLHVWLLSVGGGAWQKDLLAKGFSFSVLKGLLKMGLVSREQRRSLEIHKTSLTRNFQEALEDPQSLNKEQARAIEAFESLPKGNALLLWGVTGSGKTEVYLQLAARELAKGNHSLILAPEIGLIPQLVDRFRKRFGHKVFEYHSGCSHSERSRTWKTCLESNSPLVIVGTRSAVFLPLKPLGLIVLDEEHDSSYKQESPMPCYHARDLALDRAKRNSSKVLLGSATPSLWTWKYLTPDGPIELARLTQRISEQPLPPVYVVDMRQELADGHRRLVSRPLMQRLERLPQANAQAVVLVPRRGYSSFLSCRSCGEVVQCPHCDVSMTVHQGRGGGHWLRCHWCDYRSEVLSSCHKCGSKAFKPFGAGTQRVMEYLENELEGLRVLRFDRDTTTGRNGHRELLAKFASGDADVLVGTQMLAKGMDLPRVTLAAVLAADGLLHRPDLQASEEALQIFMQLAGRAGRGERPGEVLIQTYCPDHPVISHFVDGRYEKFLEKEACLRREAQLVPYSRACLLRLSGDSSAMTATAASAIAELIRPLCEAQGWCLVGPAPSIVSRVAGRSRWQLLLHGPEDSSLPLPADSLLWKNLPKGVSLAVDPDPIHL